MIEAAKDVLAKWIEAVNRGDVENYLVYMMTKLY